MKKILFITISIILFSCTNNDDNTIDIETPVIEPQKELYKFSNTYEILDLKYYSGPNGEDKSNEASDIFKKAWSYEVPSIKAIEFKDHLLTITEEYGDKNYLYTTKDNIITIDYNGRKIPLGYFDSTNHNIINIYKNYQVFQLIEGDEEYNHTLFRRESNFGKLAYKDFFPTFRESPKDLKFKGEFIFWANVSYQFEKNKL